MCCGFWFWSRRGVGGAEFALATAIKVFSSRGLAYLLWRRTGRPPQHGAFWDFLGAGAGPNPRYERNLSELSTGFTE